MNLFKITAQLRNDYLNSSLTGKSLSFCTQPKISLGRFRTCYNLTSPLNMFVYVWIVE